MSEEYEVVPIGEIKFGQKYFIKLEKNDEYGNITTNYIEGMVTKKEITSREYTIIPNYYFAIENGETIPYGEHPPPFYLKKIKGGGGVHENQRESADELSKNAEKQNQENKVFYLE
jgi:hypothetical protein